MSDAILVGADLLRALDYGQSYFQKWPGDTRFSSCAFRKFLPVSSIVSANNIDFVLPPLLGANCYMIQESIVVMKYRLTKSDGTSPPATGSILSLNNNILHSAFESVKLSINDGAISKKNNHYPHKSYIRNLLSFDNEAKMSSLQSMGWANDFAGVFQSKDNEGFHERIERHVKFWTGEVPTYSSDSVTYVGKLLHDMSNIDSGVPWGCEVKYELTTSKDSFRIIKTGNDRERYRLVIDSMTLHVPVMNLNASIYNKLDSSFKKGETMKIYYREFAVKTYTITKGMTFFEVDNLIQTSENPLKITFMIVLTKYFQGNYGNPFESRRYWVEDDGIYKLPLREREHRILDLTWEDIPLAHVRRMERKLWKTEECPIHSHHKHRVIKSHVALAGEKCFVESFVLRLNGERLHSLDVNSTLEDSNLEFFKMNLFNNTNTYFNNSISYNDFNESFYLVTFDLTTALSSNADMMVPSVKSGQIRTEISFNRQTYEEMTLICLTESNAVCEIDEKRNVGFSYLNLRKSKSS